jgi:hypothetical protein
MAIQTHDKFKRLLEHCAPLPDVITAVVHPCDESSLTAAVEAAEASLIVPILIGPSDKIRATADQYQIDIRRFEIVDVPHSHAAAAKAVELVRNGQAEVLMKGSLHTDELMHEAMRADTGLRTGRRVSHVFCMDVPAYHKLLLVTDAAINIYPTLDEKRDICQNAIDLALVLGVKQFPRWRSCRRWKPSAPRSPRPPTPPRCARWPTVGRSPADCSTGRWRLITQSARWRRTSRGSSRRWRATPTSCWCPIWKAAISWSSSSPSWRKPTAAASS